MAGKTIVTGVVVIGRAVPLSGCVDMAVFGLVQLLACLCGIGLATVKAFLHERCPITAITPSIIHPKMPKSALEERYLLLSKAALA